MFFIENIFAYHYFTEVSFSSILSIGIVGIIAALEFLYGMKIYFLARVRLEYYERLVIWMAALGSLLIAISLLLVAIQQHWWQESRKLTRNLMEVNRYEIFKYMRDSKQGKAATAHKYMSISGLLLQNLAIILEVLSLIQSLALVTGGLQGTKKTWIKVLRFFTYTITFISTIISMINIFTTTMNFDEIKSFDDKETLKTFEETFEK